MKAIILAAGEGTRLRPYTLDRPKCMVELDGVTLIERQLNVLKAMSVSPVIIVGGYRADMLPRTGISLKINPHYAETNMVETLFCAESELNGELIVSYGDIVYSRDILANLLQSDADISVTIDLDWEEYWRARIENPLDDAETLKMDKDGNILEIGQKPKALSDIEGQYMGLMKFSMEGVNALKEAYRDARVSGTIGNRPLSKAYMTDLLQALIDSGISVKSVPINGGWIEVDTVEDLESKVTINRLRYIN
jgi:L-glutamine-phosphate cytidylyltransferase